MSRMTTGGTNKHLLLSRAGKQHIAGIAMWTSGGKPKKVSGSCGCTWITKTSRTHPGQSRLYGSEHKVTEDPESSYTDAYLTPRAFETIFPHQPNPQPFESRPPPLFSPPIL